jgi:putative NIF3 family GTP cyclohydrolase 1 type 2
MDYHLQVGTKAAMINSLNAIYIEDCFFDGVGSHGAICAIESIKLGILKEKLLKIFGIDYLDLAGNQDDERVISKIMLVAGGGDNTEQMQIAENQKVELFLAGEFNSRFTTEWAYKNQKLVDNFLQKTKMSMVGVSHSGCEYLTMKMQMPNFFRAKYSLETTLLPQKKWWL